MDLPLQKSTLILCSIATCAYLHCSTLLCRKCLINVWRNNIKGFGVQLTLFLCFIKSNNIYRIAYSDAIELLQRSCEENAPKVSEKEEKKEEKKRGYQNPIPGMGFEPMCAYAHWNLSPTP